jgi:hypothetical protein
MKEAIIVFKNNYWFKVTPYFGHEFSKDGKWLHFLDPDKKEKTSYSKLEDVLCFYVNEVSETPTEKPKKKWWKF